jgi:hypothetical protein
VTTLVPTLHLIMHQISISFWSCFRKGKFVPRGASNFALVNTIIPRQAKMDAFEKGYKV